MATELVRYDSMCQAIASAYEVDEVKDIRDRAAALEHYARQAHNIEAERQCCEIRLRAERKAGQLLAKMEKATPRGSNQHQDVSRDPTHPRPLSDLGITRDQSSQWQKLGEVPDDQFEMALAADKPTTNGIITAAVPPVITPVSDQALWLWGRLRDFERHQLLLTAPTEVLATMTTGMLEDVTKLAPRVADWLNRIGGRDAA
jgi:hypothetical protein